MTVLIDNKSSLPIYDQIYSQIKAQQAIADYLGMKQPQYSRYERGLRDIPTDVLIRLALFYKTSTDYILGLTDHSKPYRK